MPRGQKVSPHHWGRRKTHFLVRTSTIFSANVHDPGHLRPVILKPVGRIFEISDSHPRQGKCGKCGKSLSPQKNKGLRRSRRAKTRKMRKMRTRKRGKRGKCGWLALMWLALGDTSMTRRVVEKLCTKKVCVDFLAPRFPDLLFLAFLENGKENHQKSKDFLSLPNP